MSPDWGNSRERHLKSEQQHSKLDDLAKADVIFAETWPTKVNVLLMLINFLLIQVLPIYGSVLLPCQKKNVV